MGKSHNIPSSLLCIISVLIFLFSGEARVSHAARASDPADLSYQKVIPTPKESLTKEYDLPLDNSWKIAVRIKNGKEYLSALQFKEHLKSRFLLSLSIVDITQAPHSKCILLANYSEAPDSQQICLERSSIPGKNLGNEGYLLNTYQDDFVLIASRGSSGIFYGLQTLRQLIFVRNGIAAIKGSEIKDWPDNKIRGVHFCGADYEGNILSQIDELARLKYNFAIFENWDNYHLDDLKKRQRIQKIFSYCRERFIEPVPEIGVPFPVLAEEPNAAAGVWIKDEEFEFKDRVAVPNIPAEVEIKNNDFEGDENCDLVPDGWSLGAGWSIDEVVYHGNGNRSARVCVPGRSDGNSGIAQITKDIEVTPGTWYGLRFFARTSGVGGTYPPAIRVRELDEAGNPLIKGMKQVQHAFNLDVPSRGWWQQDWRKGVFNFKTDRNCRKIQIYASIYRGYGTAWFDDFRLIRINSALVNVIKSEATDIVVTDLLKVTTYVEGVDYQSEYGEIIFKGNDFCYFDIEHIPTKIKRIDSGNIREDEKVLVSYDSAIQVWTSSICGVPYCISEPMTYEGSSGSKWKGFYRIIDDIIDHLHPKYIHFSGASEIKGINRDSRDVTRKMSNAELFAENINNIEKYAKAKDPHVRLIIWDDMLNPWHNGGDENYQVPYGGLPGKTADAIDLISKDSIIAIWWYDAADWLSVMRNGPKYFESKGFTYLGAAYKDRKNIEEWEKIAKGRSKCAGLITTTWDGWEKNTEGIRYTAEKAW